MKKTVALCFALLILVNVSAASALGSYSLTVIMEHNGTPVPGGSLTLYPVQNGEPYTEGETRPVDGSGHCVFESLEEGDYMVMQHESAPDYAPICPFAVKLTQDCVARPKLVRNDGLSPGTGDTGYVAIWLWGMGLSLAGILICIVVGRKNRRPPRSG